jgi:hypothetical protein
MSVNDVLVCLFDEFEFCDCDKSPDKLDKIFVLLFPPQFDLPDLIFETFEE